MQHSPIHSIYRKVTQDLAVPPSLAAPSETQGYVIPKNHFIVAFPGVSHMDPKIWNDADTWRPRRWLEAGGVASVANEQYQAGEKVDYGFGAVSKGTESPYQPFGAGRHRCIGEQFAYLRTSSTLLSTDGAELSIVIAAVLRNYKLTLATPGGKFPKINYQSK